MLKENVNSSFHESWIVMHWVWPQEEKGIRPHLPQKEKEESTDETLLSECDLLCRLLRHPDFGELSLLNKNDVN